MKRLLLILTMLVSGVVSSQSFDFECAPIPFPLSYNDIDFDSESGTVTDTIDQISNLFFEDAGLDKNDYSVEIMYETLTDDLVGGQAFLCAGNLNGKQRVRVWINKTTWKNTFNTDLKKIFLMYHELGHAVLRLLHTCTSQEIMFTNDPEECGPCPFNNCGFANIPIRSEEEFLESRTRMFEGIGQTYRNCGSNKGSTIIEDIFPN